jgi:hypothetical protein
LIAVRIAPASDLRLSVTKYHPFIMTEKYPKTIREMGNLGLLYVEFKVGFLSFGDLIRALEAPYFRCIGRDKCLTQPQRLWSGARITGLPGSGCWRLR